MNKEIRANVQRRAEISFAVRTISLVITKHHNILFETKIRRLNKIRWKIIHFIYV